MKIEVCQGPECGECGGVGLRRYLTGLGIETTYGHCKGLCHYAPIVHIDGECLAEATIATLMARLPSGQL